ANGSLSKVEPAPGSLHALICGAATYGARPRAETASFAARAKGSRDGRGPTHSPAGRSGAGTGELSRGRPSTRTAREKVFVSRQRARGTAWTSYGASPRGRD